MGLRRKSLIHFLEHFLWAGIVALLLAIRNFSAGAELPSLFAPAIFIWRARRTSWHGAILLGALTALLYLLTLLPGRPGSVVFFVVELLSLGTALSIFGAVVSATRLISSQQPLIPPLVWIPISLALAHLSKSGDIYLQVNDSGGINITLASLFGSIFVSFLLILLNTLLILALERINIVIFSGRFIQLREIPSSPIYLSACPLKSLSGVIPDNRAPPYVLKALSILKKIKTN